MPIRPLPLILLAAVAAAADVPCPRFAKAPAIDGDLADWAGRPTLTMSEPTVDDLKVEQACLGWDDAALYLGLSMRDAILLNLGKGAGVANGDSVELRLTLADGSLARLLVSPCSADGGGPTMHLSQRKDANGPAGELAAGTDPKAEVKGVRWAVAKDAKSWTVEVAVPLALLKPKPAAGAGLPFVLIGWDRDQPNDWNEWHRRSESANQKKPETWPKLVLAP